MKKKMLVAILFYFLAELKKQMKPQSQIVYIQTLETKGNFIFLTFSIVVYVFI